jgi:hypothetical protein
MNQEKKASPNIKNILASLLLGLIILSTACLAGIAAYFASREITAALGNGAQSGPNINAGTTTPLLNAQGTPLPPLPGEAPANNPVATLTPWDGAGRVTVLLLGLDYRDWESQEPASRSDTMILLTLDPQTKTA